MPPARSRFRGVRSRERDRPTKESDRAPSAWQSWLRNADRAVAPVQFASAVYPDRSVRFVTGVIRIDAKPAIVPVEVNVAVCMRVSADET